MNYRQVTVHPESRIAPNATLVGQVEVAKDATILFNATLRGDYAASSWARAPTCRRTAACTSISTRTASWAAA